MKTIYTKLCNVCKQEFSYYQYPSIEQKEPRKTCSNKCRYSLMKQTKHKDKENSYKIYVCIYCKKEFTAYKGGVNKYCSQKCHYLDATGKKKERKITQEDETKSYITINKKLRNYLLETLKGCEICGSRNDLQVHHKNRDRSNNTRENLLLLCKTCHAKEHIKRGELSIAKFILVNNHKHNPTKFKLCLVCKKEFVEKHKGQQTCSKSCGQQLRHGCNPMIKICEFCGKEFKRVKPKNRFCSNLCRAKSVSKSIIQ